MDRAPYVLLQVEGGFAAVQPVTGLRREGRDVMVLMAQMHDAMLDRRDELAARDPATLDPAERRDLEHLRTYPEEVLRAGRWLAEPLPPRLPDGSLPAVGPWPTGLPYEVARDRDGSCTLRDPVTGLHAEGRDVDVAMDRMHRRMLARRDELAARDPAGLDPDEQRDLARLRACPDAFLQAGLLPAGRAA